MMSNKLKNIQMLNKTTYQVVHNEMGDDRAVWGIEMINSAIIRQMRTGCCGRTSAVAPFLAQHRMPSGRKDASRSAS